MHVQINNMPHKYTYIHPYVTSAVLTWHHSSESRSKPWGQTTGYGDSVTMTLATCCLSLLEYLTTTWGNVAFLLLLVSMARACRNRPCNCANADAKVRGKAVAQKWHVSVQRKDAVNVCSTKRGRDFQSLLPRTCIHAGRSSCGCARVCESRASKWSRSTPECGRRGHMLMLRYCLRMYMYVSVVYICM